MTTLQVIYGDTKLEVPAGTDLVALKAAMSENFPELKGANVTQEGNTITFSAKAGTKGAGEMENLQVVYGDTKLEVPASTDLAALKTAMAENFPELKSATVNQVGNTITFSAKAGTKGAGSMTNLQVVYGDTKLEVPASTDLAALKTAMAENFPELKSANVVQEGNTVTFSAKAGTKGSGDTLQVVYGDTKLEVPASTDLAALKVAMAENFPELKSAEVSQVGNTVTFSAKAGTKGSGDTLQVVYGDTKLEVPASTDLAALKVAMAENFPELKSANVVQEGTTVTFSAKAGTKGN